MAMALLAGGARRLRVIDHDCVDASNLQRQVLFRTADRGRAKTTALRTHLHRRVPTLDIETRPRRFEAADLEPSSSDESLIVMDGTDDPELGFALNDLCVRAGLRAVLAGALRWRGQIMTLANGSACLRCVFEEPPPPELVPSCAAAGVLGPVTGWFGHWAAQLALALSHSDAGAGILHVGDLLIPRWTQMPVALRSDCPAGHPGRVHEHPAPTL